MLLENCEGFVPSLHELLLAIWRGGDVFSCLLFILMSSRNVRYLHQASMAARFREIFVAAVV